MSTADCHLAIVIPAYKSNYLEDTLISLSLQTCKNFHLYIGDDHSPFPIKNIVDKFTDKLDIQYIRFEKNLGGKDLVAQWERCIELTSEPWIWLFSDDDYVDSNCVENFYTYLKQYPDNELFRFNIKTVSKDNIVISQCIFPPKTDSEYLFKNKTSGKINCFAVEFIFSRNVYSELNGFQKFDLAWGSDTATWMKFARHGIITIPNSYVYWRYSGDNITSNFNKDIYIRKVKASNDFLLWSINFFGSDNHRRFHFYIDVIFIKRIVSASIFLTTRECLSTINNYIGHGLKRICLTSIILFLIPFFRLKHKKDEYIINNNSR